MEKIIKLFEKAGFRAHLSYDSRNIFFVIDTPTDNLHGTIDLIDKTADIATSANYRDEEETERYMALMEKAVVCSKEAIKILKEAKPQ